MSSLSNFFTNTLKPYVAKFRKRQSPFFAVGFHGDHYLLQLVDHIINDCSYFIETGASVGSTLAYVAKTYPDIHCISCEPNVNAFKRALHHINDYKNTTLYNETSEDFLTHLKELSPHSEALFWLDAHGNGFKWPLKQEINFITTYFSRAYILVDDFKVPELDCFGYDEYREEICSFDYIEDALNQKFAYRLYYPKYTDRTSDYHPLRGWGLIEFGHPQELEFSEGLSSKISAPQEKSF